MALAKEALVTALKSINAQCASGMTPDNYAQAIADAIDTYVKTGTVSVSGTATGAMAGGPGVPVTGTGTIS